MNDDILNQVDNFLESNYLYNDNIIHQQDIEYNIYSGINRCIELRNQIQKEIDTYNNKILLITNKIINFDNKNINNYIFTIERYKKWNKDNIEDIIKNKLLNSDIYRLYMDDLGLKNNLETELKLLKDSFEISKIEYIKQFEYINNKFLLYNLTIGNNSSLDDLNL